MKRIGLVLGIGIAALGSLAFGQDSLTGRRAPSFALPDAAMKQFDIQDYRGKWLMLDFMRTDCTHCKELSKKLDQIKAKHGAKVEILSIVVPPDNTQTAAAYLNETRTRIPILFDSGQTAMWYFKATPQKPSFDTPHLFAIDPKGMIVKDWNQLDVERPNFLPDVDTLIGGAAAASAPAKSPAAAPAKK